MTTKLSIKISKSTMINHHNQHHHHYNKYFLEKVFLQQFFWKSSFCESPISRIDKTVAKLIVMGVYMQTVSITDGIIHIASRRHFCVTDTTVFNVTPFL